MAGKSRKKQSGGTFRVGLGESHPMAKLSDRQVEEVHALRKTGMSIRRIASHMKVSTGCIQHILSGRNRAQWWRAWLSVQWIAPAKGKP